MVEDLGDARGVAAFEDAQLAADLMGVARNERRELLARALVDPRVELGRQRAGAAGAGGRHAAELVLQGAASVLGETGQRLVDAGRECSLSTAGEQVACVLVCVLELGEPGLELARTLPELVER